MSVAVATDQAPITTNSGTNTQSFSGETTITAGSDGNSVTAGGDGKNDLTFKASGTISGDIYAKDRGSNKIVFENTATINGKIISGEKDNDNSASPSGSTNHNNLIIFKGATASIGASGAKTSIILDNNDDKNQFWQGSGRFSNNTIAFGSTTAGTIYLDSLQSIGEGGGSGGKQGSKNFTLISLDNKTNNTVNTVSIDSIVGKVASNIIGSGLYDIANETYATNLFEYDTKISATKMKSGFVAEFVKTNYSASGTFTFGSIESGHGGGNYFNLNGSTTITGNILSQGDRNDQIGHDNIFVLSGTLAKIGEQNKKVSIIIENSDDQAGIAYQALSTNTLLLKATTNTLYLSELTSKGDYNTRENFNLISFNAGTNTLNSDKILAFRGHNIIGKNVITQANGYGTTLFNSGKGGSPAIKSVPTFITEFVKTSYSASGTFTFGSIEATYGGANYLNLNGTTTITGDILSKGEAHKAINDGANHNNIIAFSGTSVTIGASGKKSSITVDNNADDGQMWLAYSNNTLIFGADKNTLTLKDIKVEGDSNFDKTFNVLSFNKTTANANSLSVENVFARNGYNIIGKNLVTQGSGYNSALFALDADKETISLTENFLAEFIKDTYMADGGSYTFSGIQTNGNGVNAINIKGLVVNGDIYSNGGNNYIYATSLTGTNLKIKARHNGKNIINFSTNSTFNSILIDATTGESVLDDAKNTINFAGDSLTVSSGIATAGKWGSRGINEVNLTKTSATLAISDKGITTRKTNYTDQTGYFQQNIITFSDGGSITLNGTDRVFEETGFSFDGILARDTNKNTITFNGTEDATITAVEIRTQNNGSNTINFNGSGENTIQGIVSNYGNSTNITFASGTNKITGKNGTANGDGGVYSGGGSTTITFNGGTNTINGLLDNDNTVGGSNKYNSIINQGGTLTFNLKAGTLTTGDVWHRVYGYKTVFNVEQSSSSVTLNSLSIHGNNGNTEGVEFNFKNGGTLTFTNGAKLKYDNFKQSKLAINFNGSSNATIQGGIENTTEGIVNVVFNGSGTNKITGNDGTASQYGGIYTSGGDTTITFKGGTNIIEGLMGNDGGTSNQYNSIVNQGGTLTFNLESGTLTAQGANNSGNLNHRFNGGTTYFNVSNASSTLTLKDVGINGKGTSNGGVIFNFNNGGSVNFGTLTLKHELISQGGINPKATFNFGASGSIKGSITTENGYDSTGFTASDVGILTFNLEKKSSVEEKSQIEVTRKGTTTFTNGLKQVVNFNSDNFTFLNKTSDGNAYQTLSLNSDNASNIINFNANNGIFDMGTQALTVSNGSNIINIADGASGTFVGTITTSGSGNTSIKFASGSETSTLSLSSGTHSISSINLEGASTNNTLNLSGATSFTLASTNIGDSTNQGLKIILGNTELNATTSLTTGAKGTTTIRVEDATTGATISGGTINVTNLDMVGSGNSKVTFTAISTTVDNLIAQAEGNNELVVGNSGKASLIIGTTNSTLSSVTLAGNTAELQIKGGTQTIEALTTGADANNLFFANNTLTLGAITNIGNKAIKLNLNNSTLALKESTYALSSLVANNSLIDMAITDNNGRPRARGAKTLEIGANSGDGFKGNASFEVYVNGSTADSITFTKAQKQDNGEKSVATIIASGDINTILSGNSNLTVATVDSGSTDSLEIVGGERLIGGVVVETVLTDKNKDGTEWTLGKGVDRGAPIQYQEVASTALTVNYDLFLANFNSLNKRMGELRDNPHSQGVWARVFGGAMSNDFGAGSKTEYVTAQAGYDYSLTLGNANNYMGIAIAYGKSWTKSNSLSMNGLLGSSGSIALQDVNSNMVEVGIYNSYVMDSGWYNDTIFKFDYIMSEFSLSNDVNTMTDTSNFAMVLSDEFGYRYKFAESEKGNWYIDPQVEVAFGYFNQSDFNRAMYDTTTGIYQSTMEATQDTILTLRTRAGMSLGKKFNTAKGFASLYVGAFYEYDYINGGNVGVAGRVGGTHTTIDSIESNGRAIVNIGSNIELTEGVRMYIDVEKSFGDKQRTDMQFNFGARYSFGEKTPTISYQEQQKRRVAPLKVEEKQEATTQESKTEAPANTEVKQ